MSKAKGEKIRKRPEWRRTKASLYPEELADTKGTHGK